MSAPTAQSPSLRNSTIGSGSLGMSMGMGTSLGMSESRSHYQPGYLMVRSVAIHACFFANQAHLFALDCFPE